MRAAVYGSMIGRPRQGDMLVRSASAETIRNAPTAAARSRIRLSSQSAQSPTACGGSVMPPPDASAISASARRYSSTSSSGIFSTVASTRPVLARMCGDSHSANSAASLTTPRQSALGFPDVGGGDGQLRNGDPPTATASTSTFTSNTTGTAAGPGTLTAPASRPCRPGGYPPAATHNLGPPPRPARRYGPGAHAAARPGPATPLPAASPAGTPTGSRARNAPPGGPAAPGPHPPLRTRQSM